MNYLSALEITHVIDVLHLYSKGGAKEIIKQPQIYGSDTGFICHLRGWTELRLDDCGLLWKNLVLDELKTNFSIAKIFYWKDKADHEIAFVVKSSRSNTDIIECKWGIKHFSSKAMKAFRKLYPTGTNWVVSPQVERQLTKEIDGLEINFTSLPILIRSLFRS